MKSIIRYLPINAVAGTGLKSPSYFIYNIDFSEVLDAHIESGADITALYTNTSDAKTAFHGCDTFTMDKDKRVLSIDKNRGKYKTRSVSLEAYVMRKDLFITLVKTGAEIFVTILVQRCIT